MKNAFTKFALGTAGLLMTAGIALAAPGYTFFGEADYVLPGFNSMRAVEMISDDDPGFGGLDFDVAAGGTVADLDTIATDFNATDCGGRAPPLPLNFVFRE